MAQQVTDGGSYMQKDFHPVGGGLISTRLPPKKRAQAQTHRKRKSNPLLTPVVIP